MSKRKEATVSMSGNRSFTRCRNVRILILAITFCFSIVNEMCPIINWPDAYENVIGVSSQIITAIVSLVASIIGIAISLQNEDFFGIKFTQIYALRVSEHYSIRNIIIVSVIYCALNLTFYMFGVTMAAIGTLVAALIFLLQIVCSEVPIMAKKEEAVLQIIKDNLIDCYLNEKEASKELKDAIKYLLYKQNLKRIYDYFCDTSDQKFNQYVLLKLLEIQHDLAFEIQDGYDEKEQKIIASSLLGNVSDVLLCRIHFSDEIFAEVVANHYFLTRVLFRINELPSMRKHLFRKISGLFQSLIFVQDNHETEADLLSNILIIMVTGTVKNGDFGIIKAIQYQLSHFSSCLTKDSYGLVVFAVISMYLYYLCCSEPQVPAKIREEIKEFICEDNIIENETRITSWKKLFSESSEEFNVDYNKFMSFSMRNSNAMEYYLFSNTAKFVILQPSYLSRWYLTHLLNARRFPALDFSSLAKQYTDIKSHLREFGEKCIDENKSFVPTEEMERIVEFYSNNKREHFVLFGINEERTHHLFEYINQIKYEELLGVSATASKIDNVAFADKIRHGIESAVRNEWGFDPNLTINNAERYFAVLFEKTPDAVNFEDFIVDYSVDSVFADLKKATNKTVLYNDDNFESSIQTILLKKPQYITPHAKSTMAQIYIDDTCLKEEFSRVCGPLQEFKSKIIKGMAMVLPNGFRFNCKVEKVELRDLTEEELAHQIEEHQREDGQFVFNGVFLPRETIAKIIKDKYTVLTVVFKHQVVSSEETIFVFKPYSQGPED